MKSESSTMHISWLLHRAAFRLKPGFVKFSEAHDLTLMQLFILLSVYSNESVPMHNVSEVLVCDASNITAGVERLVNRGLLSRQENPEDRRVKMLTLTEAGRAIHEQLIGSLDKDEMPALSVLSDKERVELAMLLRKVVG